jgi:hypothetical protein
LLWPEPAGGRFNLNAGEHSHLLADHLWCDGDRAPTNQVSAALTQAKLHRSAVLVTKRAGVIAEQSAVTFATRKPDVLLDLLLAQAMPCLLANLA